MRQINQAVEPPQWAEGHWGEAPVTDVRRGERLQRMAEAMAANPGAGIPPLFAHRDDGKAAYRLFEHPEVDPDSVPSVHRAGGLEQVERAGTFVRLEATTQRDWTGRAPRPGLGPIGAPRAGTQGVVLIPCWPAAGQTARR